MCVSRNLSIVALLAALALLSGCGRTGSSSSGMTRFVSKPEPWRKSEENRCLSLNLVRPSPFLVQRASLNGPGTCGAIRPYEVSAALSGRVALKPPALLRCEMIPAFDKWMAEVVQPAAQRNYGMRIVEAKVAASYACRPRNSISGAKLSEHGHANAIDISQLQLADGRWVSVKSGWYGNARDRAFLRQLHRGACQIFKTVLGPNSDRYHHDHFHLDLAWHGRDGTRHVCR